MAKIIDGKAVSARIKAEIRQEIEAEKLKVGLAVVIVGSDPASRVYVNNKKKDCEACGIISFEYALPGDTTNDELLELIGTLNEDPKINGILVQQPLPKQINVQSVNERISALKDVDAFRFENMGRIVDGNFNFLPCTPGGIMDLLHSENISVSGKECVVVGRSNIVGKPMAMLLLHENATVTICHSKTVDLAAICRRADVLIAAVGKKGIITADMIKPGAVVIDVGMNKNDEGKLCGDVDFAAVAEKSSYITPVPGGVGPMTRAILMKNTIKAYRLQKT
ncbi:MAG: bifunctional methylenetetrahydrofolate dehydrogenase/methenyltetrahydrofolate cyclohydrolase FolD [Eubacterium sp.]|jgi:methylenetetrahydrofolate dehydrogenase (NADP+)/methenyltetrahydrofolate cyclohydrolase|nr:bifunctional methylenetetrahydrofolate dehydrogenase/methenyltetrahydrofolate cyclohydrolase FolD [Eubacterium sp.]